MNSQRMDQSTNVNSASGIRKSVAYSINYSEENYEQTTIKNPSAV